MKIPTITTHQHHMSVKPSGVIKLHRSELLTLHHCVTDGLDRQTEFSYSQLGSAC